MRICYDSTTASDIPADAEIVAGYVDGRYRWSDADWARFPSAVHVRIAVFGATDDGVVGDVETGCMTPGESLAWTRMRRAAGVDPTLYVNLANVGEVRDLFARAGEPLPHLWLAHYDGVMTIPDGYVAKQYANSDITGGHYDASSVRTFWPGIDGGHMDPRIPQFQGQSVSNVDLVEGGVAEVMGEWFYEGKGNRAILQKVVGYAVGARMVTMYPPADPDADPTLVTDAQPAFFIVATRAKT